MYAEGDCVEIRYDSAIYLKDALSAIADEFKVGCKSSQKEEEKRVTAIKTRKRDVKKTLKVKQ